MEFFSVLIEQNNFTMFPVFQLFKLHPALDVCPAE